MNRSVIIVAGLVLLLLLILTGMISAQDMTPVSQMQIGVWNQVNPGGETMCAHGDEYKFFVRPANSDKVLIHFQGGGACWNDSSCMQSFSQGGLQLYKDTVADNEAAEYTQGLFDLNNPDNPAIDYNVVLVSYCTGDLHVGDAAVTYSSPGGSAEFVTNHFGVPNAESALAWTYENFPNPSQVAITGCSAGAYGSIYHAPFIMQHYDGVPAVQLGDSGVGGLMPAGWTGFDNWNVFANMPDFLSDMNSSNFAFDQQYIRTAQQFSTNHFSQYNTFLDQVQILFAGLVNGANLLDEAEIQTVSQAWTTDMVTKLATINGSVNNFDSFIAGGSEHCILPGDHFYTYNAGGVMFSDWVADLLAGTSTDVSCDISSGECLSASG